MKTYRGNRERGKVWIESPDYQGGWSDLPLRLEVFNQHAAWPIMPNLAKRLFHSLRLALLSPLF